MSLVSSALFGRRSMVGSQTLYWVSRISISLRLSEVNVRALIRMGLSGNWIIYRSSRVWNSYSLMFARWSLAASVRPSGDPARMVAWAFSSKWIGEPLSIS